MPARLSPDNCLTSLLHFLRLINQPERKSIITALLPVYKYLGIENNQGHYLLSLLDGLQLSCEQPLQSSLEAYWTPSYSLLATAVLIGACK